jgi:hypothetical protein
LRKGTEFNAKSSLSTPRHIRKYEPLTVRIPVMPRSGIRQAVQEPLRDIRQEGAWMVIRTVMRRRKRRIIEADVLGVHQPVSREAFGSSDSGAAQASGRVVSTPSANE